MSDDILAFLDAKFGGADNKKKDKKKSAKNKSKAKDKGIVPDNIM